LWNAERLGMKKLSPQHAGILLTLASYFVWAAQAATVKYLGAAYSVWQLVLSQSVITLFIAVLAEPHALRRLVARPQYLPLLVQCLTQFAATYFYFRAVTELPLATATVIYSSAPIVVVLLSALVLRERLGLVDVLAVAIGMLGTVISVGLGSGNTSGGSPTYSAAATWVAVAAGFFWGLTVVLTRRRHGTDSTGTQLLALSGVYCLASACFVDFKIPNSMADAWLLVLLGLETYTAQWLFFEATQKIPGKLLGPLEYSSVVWAMLIGWLLFAETPGPAVLLGSAFIVASGLLISLRKPVP